MKCLTSLVVGLTLVFANSLCEAAPIPTRPVHTNKKRFRIPYRFDEAEMRRLGAREIQLYVSTDQGSHWSHKLSVSPETGRFEFQAERDGEYWFAVRTLDSRDQLHPRGNPTDPGLKVIVDTIEPKFDITLRQLAPGKVQLAWNAFDTNLDPTKLRLEYIQTGARGWQQVGVTPQPNGQTTWSVPRGGTVAVRGTISDRAANVASVQSQVSVAPAEQAVPKPALPDFHEPIAGRTPEFATAPALSDPVLPDATLPSSVFPSLSGNSGRNPGPFSTTSSSFNSNPPVTQNRYPQQFENHKVASAGGRQHRAVNSQKFQIGYRIDDVGPSGVGQVELFITENNGQKWYKYGDDKDRQSPFQVDVRDDGVYGFALRVRSGVGLAEEPPQTGEKPSIVIVVDRKPPQAQLLPLQQGQGLTLNKIQIRWKISDANPADRPIALSYSSQAAGPWEPISGWQRDTGSFLWTIGPGVPSRLYVRLLARDAAGNISRVETPTPIIVDLAKPSARIVDVESTTSAGPQF